MAQIEINGQLIEAEEGSMLIAAADAAGIYIPRFCYHDKLSIAANCRMCLVEVENAPKPLPACATPVTNGMKVQTRSELARDAQKGTMEFLLINHPLDCPICDQGGECELQDLAVGYGKDVSRYSEGKRVVFDKDIGPLIATDLTRCIQCTRCVRFGQEIAGVMELGMTGRGEHSEIMTFMGHAVNSELSGNVIDLCPVGALTSKPFRFKARSWEMQQHDAVAVHDTVGSNTLVETLRGEVMRVLPRANEQVNEVWLSDRDRFSYEALNTEQRLLTPRLKIDGVWQDTDWQTALEHVAAKLKAIAQQFGGEGIGALVSPLATLEEFVLLRQLLEGLGSNNIDYRLRQQDFRADAEPSPPLLGGSISELESASAVVLIGSNIRKEQPILGHRLRKAVGNGAQVIAVNPLALDYAMPLAENIALPPSKIPRFLARLATRIATMQGKTADAGIQALAKTYDGDEAGIEAIASLLVDAGNKARVLVGGMAQMDVNYAVIQSLAGVIAELVAGHYGRLEEGNAVAAWQAGCLSQTGRNALQMLDEPLKACLLFNTEPAFDCLAGSKAVDQLREAGMVVYIGSYRSDDIDDIAHIQLPLACHVESDGTHVNCEGRMQSWHATVKPRGDARPGWKVLRVLGNYLALDGFDYLTADAVKATCAELPVDRQTPRVFDLQGAAAAELERIYSLPPYRCDAQVRQSRPLQDTADNPPVVALLHPDSLPAAAAVGDPVLTVSSNGKSVQLPYMASNAVPAGCVVIPVAMPETTGLAAAASVEVTR